MRYFAHSSLFIAQATNKGDLKRNEIWTCQRKGKIIRIRIRRERRKEEKEKKNKKQEEKRESEREREREKTEEVKEETTRRKEGNADKGKKRNLN